MKIYHPLVLLLVTSALVTCDSDLSSSEEKDSYEKSSLESSEELLEKNDGSSEESSEESKIAPKIHLNCVEYMKVEEVESCFAKRCEADCATINIKTARGAETILKSCGWGCANQVSTFKAAQSAFHHTAADLLLGTAVDKCWDGCVEMFQESGQSSCISGCETMRKIQRDQLRSNVGLERKADKNEDKEEADIKVDEMKKDTEDIKVNDIQSVGKSEEDPGHLRTYILWHPMSQQQAYQAFNVMFNLAQKMFEDMDDLDNLDNKKGTLRGWQDDRRQLRIPQYHPQVAALTSIDDEATDVYDKVVDSISDLKNKIQETVTEPAFKENMFYLLMTICCFLLLVALYDNCTEDTSPEPEEDHFILFPDKAAAAKLPSYEDCIKADKILAVDLTDVHKVKEAGDITKKDLNLSVVLDEDDTQNK